MLQLVLGRSGMGKTYALLDRLEQNVASERRQIWLVPEQYSFESERAILQRLGQRRAAQVEVLSFTRLAQRVFDEVGGVSGLRMDDATRVLLMSRAIEQVADHLTLYRRHVADADYLSAMIALLEECKQCTVTAELLSQTALQLEEGTLRRKTEELSLIFAAYEALTADSYLDPLDDLTRLAERLPDSGMVKQADVYVDAFKGFTEQEMQVLSALMASAASMTVTLCTDTLTDEEEGLGLFSAVTRTANRLQELARRRFVTVKKPLVLTENHRAQHEALRRLEEDFFSPCPSAYDEPTDAVTVTACGDIYDECAYIARTVRRLLREEGARCRDMAVAVRNLQDYRGVLDVALEKEGIACYMDQRDPVLNDPLIAAVTTALRCATGRWETERLLRLMKTGVLGFAPNTIGKVENYVFLWQIDGNLWKEPWTQHPDGWDLRADEATDRRLSYLNLLRRRLMAPLTELRASLGARTSGRNFARAIYRYLTRIRVSRVVRLQVKRLAAAGEHTLSRRQERIWDVLMELLDRFSAALGDTELSTERLTELFVLVASKTDMGDIPRGLDAVQVGDAGRMRFSSPKIVFAAGANEGVFPAGVSVGGLISDGERRRLTELGLPMTDSGAYTAAEERFFAYTAVTAPSERLFISYLKGNAQGEIFVPSTLVQAAKAVLPHCREEQAFCADGSGIESAEEAFSYVAAYGDRGTVGASLAAVLKEKPAYHERLQQVKAFACHEAAAFRDAAVARRFFGDNMVLSPSKVDQYHQCRFAYFCRYGLKVKELRPATLDSARFGSLVHYVMQKLLPVYVEQGVATVTREQVAADAALTVQWFVEEQMGTPPQQTARFEQMLKRLVRNCENLLWRVVQELRQSRFVPTDYELGIGIPDEQTGEMVPSTVLTLPDGAKVRVAGVVDRVDVYHTEDTAYVRVVDYKTGAKEFRLSDVVEGINVQMLIYLFSLWQNGGPRYGTVTPAGVLYLPSKQPVVRVERNTDEAALEQERIRTMKMNGLLLDDPAIIRAMENEAAGVFIPAKLGKNGEVSKASSVASLEQLGLLKKKIERLLCDMAQTLRDGDVAALPLAGAVDGCAYCEYRAVCGHEPHDPVRYLGKTDAETVLKMLEETENVENSQD